jgi:hypothetical protein
MLDLSHWFYHKHHRPLDLSAAYDNPEYELIDYHKKIGAGFYLPNLGSFFRTRYADDVKVSVNKDFPNGIPRITWRLETPVGTIERKRIWEEDSYSWAIEDWGVRNEQDIKVLAYALSGRRYEPLGDRYQAWTDAFGDMGVVYIVAGYSAMGQILNYWMGIEGTMYQVERALGYFSKFESLGIVGKKKFRDETVPAGSATVIYRVTALRSTRIGQPGEVIVHLGVGGHDYTSLVWT